jgi:hypothetical protein
LALLLLLLLLGVLFHTTSTLHPRLLLLLLGTPPSGRQQRLRVLLLPAATLRSTRPRQHQLHWQPAPHVPNHLIIHCTANRRQQRTVHLPCLCLCLLPELPLQ